jgi:hypothetical protein
MKRILIALALTLSLAFVPVTYAVEPVDGALVWDYADDTGIVEYRIYKETSPGVWTFKSTVPVDSPDGRWFTITLDGVTPTTFAVTAFNGFFESDRSNPVETPLAPGSPGNLRIVKTQN